MVKGKLYRVSNLNKNKHYNVLAAHMGTEPRFLWAANTTSPEWDECRHYADGDLFLALGKAEQLGYQAPSYWVAAPNGHKYRITGPTRKAYFRRV